MGTITKRWLVDGVPTAPTSIVFEDSTGTFGVKRVDTDEVVVAAGTALTEVSTGVYNYTFTTVGGVEYSYVVKVVYAGDTFYYPGTITFAASTDKDNLLYIRTQVAKLSGRYDLVLDGFVDNGLNFFINTAQSWLDENVKADFTYARQLVPLTEGLSYFLLNRPISVQYVYHYDSEGVRRIVAGTSIDRALYNYTGNESTGIPAFWAYDTPALAPAQSSLSDLSPYTDTSTIQTATPYLNKAIRLFPSSDGSGTIQVYGRFYSPELVEDTDKSPWTVNSPATLIYATISELEGALATESASNAWFQRVMRSIDGINQRHTEAVTANYPVLEG